MTRYEKELQSISDDGIKIYERYDLGNATAEQDMWLLGLCYKDCIALAKELETEQEKLCILAEEYAHWQTTVGDILDQSNVCNRKQELQARALSYDMLFGIDGIADAVRYGCRDYCEAADYLGVTEQVLRDAVDYYHSKFGTYVELPKYDLYFEPYLMVIDREDGKHAKAV